MTGPLEVFDGANEWRTHRGGGPVYDIRTASLGSTVIRTSSGLRLAPDEDLRGIRPAQVAATAPLEATAQVEATAHRVC